MEKRSAHCRVGRGTQTLKELPANGDPHDPKNKADLLVDGVVYGVHLDPYSGLKEDWSSETMVQGRVHNPKSKSPVSSFTVKDDDFVKNLEVNFSRDFEGDGRLEIVNRGPFRGDAQINFPLGSLRNMTEDFLAAVRSEDEASSVTLHKEKSFARVEIESAKGSKVFVVRDGYLFEDLS